MTQLLPPKKEVALALLERSNVDVYLDPRAKGVVVPPQFRKEPRLILKIGLNMPVPIPDLRLDEESMSCTLSFNRSPFYCVVPWSSVFAMVGEDGRGMVWPDDVPQELAVKVVEPGDAPRPRAVDRDAPSRPRGVEAGASASASGASSSSSRRGEGARRSSKLAEDVPNGDRASAKGGAGAAGNKRKKKKDEERPRPVLVAVPSAAPSSASSSSTSSSSPSERGEHDSRGDSASPGAQGPQIPREIRQAPEQRRPQPSAHPSAHPSAQPSAPRDGVSPVPQARPRTPMPPSQRRPPPSDGPARPKRELPPYLRVVK